MALTDKLTAIGNAIRGKTGGSSQLSLTDMATAISGLQIDSGPHGAFRNIEISISTKTTNKEYTVSFNVGQVINYNRNWALFFPILTAANTYGVGICSNSQMFGSQLFTNHDGVANYYKTAKIKSTALATNYLGVTGGQYFLDIMPNINIVETSSGITITNTDISTYPRATSGSGLLIYYQDDINV